MEEMLTKCSCQYFLLQRTEATSTYNVPVGICKDSKLNFTRLCFSRQSRFQVEIRGPEAAVWSVYLGSTAAQVEKSYDGQNSVFSWLTTSQSQGPREVQLTPFNSSCLGVAVTKREGVEARLTLLHVSYYRLGACLAGSQSILSLKFHSFSILIFSQACSCSSWLLDWPAAHLAITSQASALVLWRLP